MLKSEALRILKTGRNVAKAAGVTPPTVSNWGPIVPAGPALRISVLHPQIPLRVEDYALPPREVDA